MTNSEIYFIKKEKFYRIIKTFIEIIIEFLLIISNFELLPLLPNGLDFQNNHRYVGLVKENMKTSFLKPLGPLKNHKNCLTLKFIDKASQHVNKQKQ